MPYTRCSAAVLSILLAIVGSPAVAAVASTDETAVTIYSSQQPGAISPDFYRPLPGAGVPPASSVPGYAMVR